MNNRYLFRGIIDGSNEWLIDNLKQENGKFLIENKYGCWIDVKKETVGQCTSLKDTNNKLIFGGDVVKDKFKSIYVVEYYDKWAAFRLKKIWGIGEDGTLSRFIAGSQSFIGINTNDLKIIGNIYENSELLK